MIFKISSEKIEEFIEEQHSIDGMVSMHDFELWLEEQPRVGEWIPCSERLPDVEYISGKDPVKGHYLTCNHNGNMSVFSWCEGWNCYRHLDGSAHKDYEITDIVAWMPLPPAYKEGE